MIIEQGQSRFVASSIGSFNSIELNFTQLSGEGTFEVFAISFSKLRSPSLKERRGEPELVKQRMIQLLNEELTTDLSDEREAEIQSALSGDFQSLASAISEWPVSFNRDLIESKCSPILASTNLDVDKITITLNEELEEDKFAIVRVLYTAETQSEIEFTSTLTS